MTKNLVAAALSVGLATGCTLTQDQVAGPQTVLSEDASRLLAALRQQLDEVAAASTLGQELRRGGDLDLRSLVGLRRDTLRDGLGPPSINCRDKPAVNMTTGERERISPCQADEDLGYSFFTWPKGTAGGGPQLLLQFDREGLCTRTLWRKAQ
jgi:hypothetical protein